MKYRDYKNLSKDNIYHIYNRGVGRQDIFLERADYQAFLKRLLWVLSIEPVDWSQTNLKPLPPEAFSILAYCLMPNHYHILIRQNADIPIGSVVRKAFTSYAAYFNKKYQRVGHLFQDIFKAKLVDSEPYLIKLSAYIHLNPEEKSFTYEHSSIKEYLGLPVDRVVCEKDYILSHFRNSTVEYAQFLKDQPTKDQPV